MKDPIYPGATNQSQSTRLYKMHLVLLGFCLPTLVQTCIVPLSVASNQPNGYIVNDNSDGINTVHISISHVNYERRPGPTPSVLITTTTQGHSPELHTRCISVQTDTKTVAESCEGPSDNNESQLTWEIRLAEHGQSFAHAFVRSKLTRMVLSIASAGINQAGALSTNEERAGTVDILVMSKDRPLEVEALLDSIHRLCVGFNRVFVIFFATDAHADRKYRMTAARYPHVEFIVQEDFREDVLRVVGQSEAEFMFPIVGEMLFVRPFNFTEAVGYLRGIGPYATVHPRLGTQLDLFRSLHRRFGRRFYVPLDREERFFVYDATLAQQNVCDGKPGMQAIDDEKWLLNDFWWIQHLGGVIHSRKLMLDTWNSLAFRHPGDLEVAWSTKARHVNGAKHVMPRLTAIVANNNAAPTRIDHVANAGRNEVESWRRSQDRAVSLLYNNYCFPDTQALIISAQNTGFPKEVRTEVDLISHCMER